MRVGRSFVLAAAIALCVALSALPAPTAAGATQAAGTTRLSLDSFDKEMSGPNGGPFSLAVSLSGRFVAFTGVDPCLDPVRLADACAAGGSGQRYVFWRDRDVDGDGIYDQPGRSSTVAVSVPDGASGEPATGYDSYEPSISGDGRYVAFASDADNLVPGDINHASDVFVHDVVAGTTTRVSVSNSEAQAEYRSFAPAISVDGRYVAFASDASNLVDPVHSPVPYGGPDSNHVTDVFVRDRLTASTIRASVGPHGEQLSLPSSEPAVTANGRWVMFVNGQTARSVYAHDRDADGDGVLDEGAAGSTTTRLESVAANGQPLGGDSFSPTTSASGAVLAFTYLPPSATRATGNFATRQVLVRTRDADCDGRLDEPGETATVVASLNRAGGLGNADSQYPSLSADGRLVSFASSADDLVSGDLNASMDVFAREVFGRLTRRVSLTTSGLEGDGSSEWGVPSANGRFVVFASDASNLVAEDNNGSSDVFSRDLGAAPPPVPHCRPRPPRIVRFEIHPRKFRPAKGRRGGAMVRLALDAAGTASFTVARVASGRRVGGRCRPATRGRRKFRRCTRWITLKGSVGKRVTSASPITFRFDGRWRGRRLPPRRYVLIAKPRRGTLGGRVTAVAFTIRR
jgi:Tol biopolymer transport system component